MERERKRPENACFIAREHEGQKRRGGGRRRPKPFGTAQQYRPLCVCVCEAVTAINSPHAAPRYTTGFPSSSRPLMLSLHYICDDDCIPRPMNVYIALTALCMQTLTRRSSVVAIGAYGIWNPRFPLMYVLYSLSTAGRKSIDNLPVHAYTKL